MNERPRLSRRQFVTAGGGAAMLALAGCSGGDGGGSSDGGSTGGESAVTVGVLEDRSGNFSLVGTPKHNASMLAIEEINADGGILGREIGTFTPDPQSDNQRYQQLTKRAIQQENVDALWAGYSSATRESIRPIIDREDQLYFYTTQYEGGVCDENVFAVGPTARQQLGSVLPYLREKFGPDIYTIAADYNFGQLSADWIERLAGTMDANLVGEEFVPLSQGQFGSSINRIQEADPDVIMSILVGQNHTAFYSERASAELDVPIGTSTSMALTYEHLRLDPPALQGVHVGTNYMEEFDTERNNDFVDRYYEMFPDAAYLNQSAHNNYFSAKLYKKAAEKAGTTDQDEVIATLQEGMDIAAPEGDISLHGPTHHMSHHMRIARADENHEITFLGGDEGQLIEPTFLQDIGCDLTAEVETTQYTPEDL